MDTCSTQCGSSASLCDGQRQETIKINPPVHVIRTPNSDDDRYFCSVPTDNGNPSLSEGAVVTIPIALNPC